MELLKRDIIWRPLALLLIAAIASSAWFWLESRAQADIVTPMEGIAESFARTSAIWFQNHYQKIEKLTEDGSIKRAFEEGQWRSQNGMLRRVLYEFSYINKINAAYIVNPSEQPSILKTSDAPTLPAGIFSVVRENSGGGDTSLVTLNVEGQPNMLVAHTVDDQLGEVIGYVAYLIPFSAIAQQIRRPTSLSVPDFNLGLLRIQDGTRAIGMLNITTPNINVLGPSDTNLPIFNTVATSGGVFNHQGIQTVAATTPLPRFKNWVALAWIDVATAKSGTSTTQIIVAIVAILAALAVLLIPGQGTYGQAVGKKLKKILPKMPEKPKEVLPKGMTEQGKKKLEEQGQFKPSDLHKPATPAKSAAAKIDLLNPVKPPPVGSGAEDPLGLKTRPDLPPPPTTPAEPKQVPAKLVKLNEQAAKKKPTRPVFNKEKYNKDGNLTDNIVLYILRRALKEKALKLLFQPVLDAKTQKVVKHEAFLRVLDEDGTELTPGQFMKVAEENGLMDELDRTVMELVIEKHFKQKKPPAPTELLLNLSGATFDSLSYLDTLMNAIMDNTVPPGMVTFEVRSQAILTDKKAMNFIRECRDLGIRFGIDYFGGGPQTLHAAKTLKFDYIKVDGFRYKEIAKSKPQQQELLQLAATAKKIGLPIVLERVETPLLAKLATKVGIPYLQGYFFSQPKAEFHTLSQQPQPATMQVPLAQTAPEPPAPQAQTSPPLQPAKQPQSAPPQPK